MSDQIKELQALIDERNRLVKQLDTNVAKSSEHYKNLVKLMYEHINLPPEEFEIKKQNLLEYGDVLDIESTEIHNQIVEIYKKICTECNVT